MPGFEFSSTPVCIHFQNYIFSTKGAPSRSHWLHSQAYCARIRLGLLEAQQLRGGGTVVFFITSTPRSQWYSGRVDLIETSLPLPPLPPPLPLCVSLLSFIYSLTRIFIHTYIQLSLNTYTPNSPYHSDRPPAKHLLLAFMSSPLLLIIGNPLNSVKFCLME